MQKIMACLQRPTQLDTSEWQGRINEFLNSHMATFRSCQYLIEDQQVEAASHIRLENTSHPKNAIVTVWTEHTYQLDDFYTDLDSLGRHETYAVVESCANPFKQRLGRTAGFCQICFLTKPNTQNRQQWLDLWLVENTQVAIKTQSSYSLVQNVTTMSLPVGTEQTNPCRQLNGIVEDYFPNEAMNSREAFYAATGNRKKYLQNEQELISSCLKFIDFDHFDCIPMSHYVLKTFDW